MSIPHALNAGETLRVRDPANRDHSALCRRRITPGTLRRRSRTASVFDLPGRRCSRRVAQPLVAGLPAPIGATFGSPSPRRAASSGSPARVVVTPPASGSPTATSTVRTTRSRSTSPPRARCPPGRRVPGRGRVRRSALHRPGARGRAVPVLHDLRPGSARRPSRSTGRSFNTGGVDDCQVREINSAAGPCPVTFAGGAPPRPARCCTSSRTPGSVRVAGMSTACAVDRRVAR